MAVTVFHIKSDESGNGNVTKTPGDWRLKTGDMVQFTCEGPGDTAIRFVVSSPFVDPQVAPEKGMSIGSSGKGPFECVNVGNHHFECGRLMNGLFTKWENADGTGVPGADVSVEH
jgi:hypothetical protein